MPRWSSRVTSGNVVAYVGLGANLGPAEMTLRAAIAALDQLPLTRLRIASSLYRTLPGDVRIRRSLLMRLQRWKQG